MLDWSQPARALHCKIRAFNPYPIAATTFRSKPLRLWEVGALDTGRESAPGVAPGTVLAADKTGVRVQTGEHSLVLTRLQAEGGRVLAAWDFVNGNRMQTGERLGT